MNHKRDHNLIGYAISSGCHTMAQFTHIIPLYCQCYPR